MKTEPIKKSAVVLESLPNIQFKVKIESGQEIRAYLCGKMNQNKIKVLVGDKVVVEIPQFIKIENCIGRIIRRG
jgi:translation initiation factor IF-1